MKITVAFTVDIDPQTWTTNYGITGRAEIRADVRDRVIYAVGEHLRHITCDETITITAH